MKIEFYFDVTQVIGETWQVEVDDDVNLVDFIEAVTNNPNLIFSNEHPNQIGDARLYDSESYDTLSMKLFSAKVVK